VLTGTYVPDAFTKWYVYGVSKGPIDFGATEPVQFHRGWPGAGFTHSILMMVAAAGLVLLFTKSKPWALGILLGGLAHNITDTSDTVGTMLLRPFWNENISTGFTNRQVAASPRVSRSRVRSTSGRASAK
jgi:membrane-bound metal-dependent hydrolase YbcI (DUF457 family)